MPYKDKNKQREYQRRWMTERRAAWLTENGPCVGCGSWDDLEVDHVDPTQKAMQPGTIWSRSARVAAEELAKCQVLCGGCHLEKSTRYRRERAEVAHNPKTQYRNGCRCDECRGYQREHNRTSRKYDSIEKKTVGVLK